MCARLAGMCARRGALGAPQQQQVPVSAMAIAVVFCGRRSGRTSAAARSRQPERCARRAVCASAIVDCRAGGHTIAGSASRRGATWAVTGAVGVIPAAVSLRSRPTRNAPGRSMWSGQDQWLCWASRSSARCSCWAVHWPGSTAAAVIASQTDPMCPWCNPIPRATSCPASFWTANGRGELRCWRRRFGEADAAAHVCALGE